MHLKFGIYHHSETTQQRNFQRFLDISWGETFIATVTLVMMTFPIFSLFGVGIRAAKIYATIPKAQGETEYPAEHVLAAFKTCFKKEQDFEKISDE